MAIKASESNPDSPPPHQKAEITTEEEQQNKASFSLKDEDLYVSFLKTTPPPLILC